MNEKIDNLVRQGVAYREVLNRIERAAAQDGKTSNSRRFDWSEGQTGFKTTVAQLAELVGNEQIALKLINGKMN